MRTQIREALQRLGDAGVEALAASPYLASLTVLNLSHNRIGDAGATSPGRRSCLKSDEEPMERPPHKVTADAAQKGFWTVRRIMFIENKGGGLQGSGRIGWVEFSKSRRSFYYQGRRLEKTKGGYKYNCVDVESGEAYWVSGPHKDGNDLLYGGVVEIDDDAREEYWSAIRMKPENKDLKQYRSGPSTRTAPAKFHP
jgi:hypothetical protein